MQNYLRYDDVQYALLCSMHGVRPPIGGSGTCCFRHSVRPSVCPVRYYKFNESEVAETSNMQRIVPRGTCNYTDAISVKGQDQK